MISLLALSAAYASSKGLDALVEQGTDRVRAGDLVAAEEILDRALARKPRAVEALYGRAIVDSQYCGLQGTRCDTCVERFDQVLAIEAYRFTHYQRANCLIGLGRPEEGLGELDLAIAQYPEDGDNYAGRAWLEMTLGDPIGECAHFAAAEARGWTWPRFLPEPCALPAVSETEAALGVAYQAWWDVNQRVGAGLWPLRDRAGALQPQVDALDDEVRALEDAVVEANARHMAASSGTDLGALQASATEMQGIALVARRLEVEYDALTAQVDEAAAR